MDDKRYWVADDALDVGDIHLKSVEFAISYGDRDPQVGVGILHAYRNKEKGVCLEVTAEVAGPGKFERTQHTFVQTERTRFRLEQPSSPDVAAFRLSSYTLPPASPDADYEFQ